MKVRIVLKDNKGRWTFDLATGDAEAVRLMSLKALEWHLRMMGIAKGQVANVIDQVLMHGVIEFWLETKAVA